MRDNALRRGLKFLALCRYNLDLSVTRWIQRRQGEARFRLEGKCSNCGGCCETPMIQAWAPFFYLKTLRWLFLAWHRRVNGFELLREERLARVFVFRCTHWSPEALRCDSYESRPGMCRDYPANLLDDPNPEFLPRCGYRAVAENAELIRESLADLDLPPETLARLEKEFRVDSRPSEASDNDK